jgi:hypothetical protein
VSETRRIAIDHLVYAAPRLELGIEAIEAALGVRPVPGGRHPSFGTHNAVAALGPAVYLEVIAPDPDLPAPSAGVGFGAGAVERPRLVTWALRTSEIERLAAAARLGPVSEGRRERADGTCLTWRLTDPYEERLGGVVPFLIDWGDTRHPARSAPGGAELLALRLEHPAPRAVRRWLERLGVEMEVTEAERPGLAAVVRARGRELVLR